MNSQISHTRLKTLLMMKPGEPGLYWRSSGSGRKTGVRAGCLHDKGYRRVTVDGVRYREHRLVWFYVYGKWPIDQIDHINHIRDDNRIENLRAADNTDNQRNAALPSNNNSGRVGVCFDKKRNKWYSYISLAGKNKSLGHFEDFDEAIQARRKAESKHGFHKNHGSTTSGFLQAQAG